MVYVILLLLYIVQYYFSRDYNLDTLPNRPLKRNLRNAFLPPDHKMFHLLPINL